MIMKITARIPGGISPNDVGEEIFGKLSRMFPENIMHREGRPPLLGILAAIDDPRLSSAQQMLEAAGLTPWKEHSRNKKMKEYSLEFNVVYESSDLESALLLQPKPPSGHWFSEYNTDPAGRLVVQDRQGNLKAMGKPIVGLAAEWQHILVVPKVREILEQAHLSHLKFRETGFVDVDLDPIPWSDEPYVELTSDLIILPPISREYAKWDEPTPRMEHFRRRDLAAVPEFDLAVAPIPGRVHSGFLVSSKRLYHVCADHDLKFDWIPVHIDD
jgi:hypothetical protein